VSQHPTALVLEGFLKGTLSPRVCRKVVRHLARGRGCDQCQALVAAPMAAMAGDEEPAGAEAEAGDAYGKAIDRACRTAVRWAGERPRPGRRSERLVEDVVSGRREWSHLTSRDLAALDPLTWVEVWIKRCDALRFRDPIGMLRAAEAACGAAYGLDPAVYSEVKRQDTCALAWAELANAHRVGDQLDEAERALDRAGEHLGFGSGDPGLLARLAEISASLACDQRCFDMAHLAADRAGSCYLEAGDPHRAGRVLLKRSHFSACEGEPLAALGWLLEGFELLDLRRSPELGRTVIQNAILYMVRAGLFREAQRLLWTARLHRLLPDEGLNRVRLRATEGTIWEGLDDLDRAELAFQQARAGYEKYSLWIQAGIAGLDVAKVWLRQGRQDKVLPLAEELLEAFIELDIRREAVAALEVLRKACVQKRLTLALVTRLAEFLRALEAPPAGRAASR
jgi:tetratricopeptide (TPR) repeat protein